MQAVKVVKKLHIKYPPGVGINPMAKVLYRDNYTCAWCGFQAKITLSDKPRHQRHNKLQLQAHHIVQRSDGGNNSPNNLITLCGPAGRCSIHRHVDSGLWIIQPELVNNLIVGWMFTNPFTGEMRWRPANRKGIQIIQGRA